MDDKFVLSVVQNGFMIGLSDLLPGGSLRALSPPGTQHFRFNKANMAPRKAGHRTGGSPNARGSFAEINLPNQLARPSPERVRTIIATAMSMRNILAAPVRTRLQFWGYLTSLVDMLADCRLHMRPLQIHVLQAYRPNTDPLSMSILVSNHIPACLAQWMSRPFLNQGKPLRAPLPSLTVTTDASLLGWGAVCAGNVVSGNWAHLPRLPHINQLEFRAVMLVCRHFHAALVGRTVLIQTDNVTVASYINKQGGTHSISLNALAAHFWRWCRVQVISPVAVYLPRQDFLIADFLSSGRELPSEWMLHPEVFAWLQTTIGPLQVDLFASSLNHQLRLYCTRSRDPEAWMVDAFSFPWGGFGVAQEALVSDVNEPPDGSPPSPAGSPRPDQTTVVRDDAQQPDSITPNCVAIVVQAGRQAGLSHRAAEFIAHSHRDPTVQSYNSRLTAYFSCEEQALSPRTTPLHRMADFFRHLFGKGLALWTIRAYRSAIAVVHSGFEDGSMVFNAPTLTRLFKAFFLKRPPTKTLLPSWSLPRVMRALAGPPFEPLAKASLARLTWKTAFLLAVASGHRLSTLHALSTAPGHIHWERDGVRLILSPTFIAKNQTSSTKPVEIFISPLTAFSSVPEDKVWCPVRSLKWWYLDRTKSFRKHDQLFLICKEPHSPASWDSVSRWIVNAIKAAGPEALTGPNLPHANDTRSISTSWALFAGVGQEDILKAAYWSSANSFISYYLRDVLASKAAFSGAALASASGTSRPTS
ncbi:uncharacterized protein [Diadema setosum]|uniref:uncharacterized protein n=1 Tax=Diadema setosum TaxID=31175 RepID=UPI003B3B8E39